MSVGVANLSLLVKMDICEYVVLNPDDEGQTSNYVSENHPAYSDTY